MNSPQNCGYSVAKMLTAWHIEQANLSCIPVDRNGRVPSMAADVETGADCVGVRRILGNVCHSIRTNDRKVVERCLFRHRLGPSLLCCLPIEFGMFQWLCRHSHRYVLLGSHICEEV